MNIKNHKQRGFTIIEVMIVLAIGGLIMLIVFLAIPALQRNQRNNARNSDASRIAAGINECLANRNGQTTSCLDDAQWNVGTLAELSTVDATNSATTDLGTGSTTAVVVGFQRTCNPQGDNDVAGSARQYAVLFQLEGSPNINRCVSA